MEKYFFAFGKLPFTSKCNANTRILIYGELNLASVRDFMIFVLKKEQTLSNIKAPHAHFFLFEFSCCLEIDQNTAYLSASSGAKKYLETNTSKRMRTTHF